MEKIISQKAEKMGGILICRVKSGRVIGERKAVKIVEFYSPELGEKFYSFSVERPIFFFVSEINRLIQSFEKVIILSRTSILKPFSEWYQRYFDWEIPVLWFRQAFFKFQSDYRPLIREDLSLKEVYDGIVKGKYKEIQKDYLKLTPLRKLFLPEVKPEILDGIKGISDEELPLKIEEKRLFTKETLEVLKFLNENSQIIKASQTVIKGEEVRTERITLDVALIWKAVAVFFFEKYLNLCKNFEGFYEKYPLTEAIEKVIPEKFKERRFLSTFLSELLKQTRFAYEVEGCSIYTKAFKILKTNGRGLRPLEESEFKEIMSRLERHLKGLERLDSGLLERYIAKAILHITSKKGGFVGYDIVEEVENREIGKLLSRYSAYLREFAFRYRKEVYFEAFWLKFKSLIPQTLYQLEFGFVDRAEYEKLPCKLLEQPFKPSENVILSVVDVLNLPEFSNSVRRVLPQKLDLISLYSKVLKVF